MAYTNTQMGLAFAAGALTYAFLDKIAVPAIKSCFVRGGNNAGTGPPLGFYESICPGAQPPVRLTVNYEDTLVYPFINGQHGFDPTPENMLELTLAFHDFISDKWVWAPSVAGASAQFGGRLLDGSVNAGECGFVANALYLLLISQPPFGVGVAANTVGVQTYTGEYGKGFISHHQNKPLDLDPDIVTPDGKLIDFYLWENHKVVQYPYSDRSSVKDALYYDPTYGNSQSGDGGFYAALKDMAIAQIYSVMPPSQKNQQTHEVEEVKFTDTVAPAEFLGFYFKLKDGRNIGPFNPGHVEPSKNPSVLPTHTSPVLYGYDPDTDYLADLEL